MQGWHLGLDLDGENSRWRVEGGRRGRGGGVSTGYTTQSGRRPGSWAREQGAEEDGSRLFSSAPAQASAETGSSEPRLWLRGPSRPRHVAGLRHVATSALPPPGPGPGAGWNPQPQ